MSLLPWRGVASLYGTWALLPEDERALVKPPSPPSRFGRRAS